MSKKSRVPRPKGELEYALKEQIDLLELHCASFDSGAEVVGKHIATALRVLLHHHGQSKSLLEQLKLRSGLYFFDSAGPLNPRNLLTECNLVMYQVNDDGAKCLPLVLDGDSPIRPRLSYFPSGGRTPFLKIFAADFSADSTWC